MKQSQWIFGLFFLLLTSPGFLSRPSTDQQTQLPETLKEKLLFFSGVVEEHTEDLPEMIKAGRIRVLTTLTFGNYFIFEYMNEIKSLRMPVTGATPPGTTHSGGIDNA